MKNKKAMELSLQTIVILVIVLVVLFVMIFFFTNHYGDNSDTLLNVSGSAIENAKNTIKK